MDSGSQFSASVSKSRVSATRGPDDEVERNPFTLPSDEEVFRMRATERRQRIENREKQEQMKEQEILSLQSEKKKLDL